MADSYEQLLAKLEDVPDPPLPPGKPLTAMSAADARKNTITLLVVGVLFAAATVTLLRNGHTGWGSVTGVLTALVLMMAFGNKVRVGACPYCAATIPVTDEESREPLQCERCADYSTYDGKVLRPTDPSTTSESPKFDAPLFKDARWPKACVACGAPPTRLEDSTGRTLNAGTLLLARVSVSSAQATGIPYCALHKDAVKVKVRQDRSVRVLWSSLGMMRRYLKVNRQQRPRGAGLS